MKAVAAIITVSTIFGVTQWSCDDLSGVAEAVVGPVSNSNLIANYSFEDKNGPTLAGWTVWGDTPCVQLVSRAPSGGGNWSLELEECGIVYTAFAVPRGTHIYTMSVCAKFLLGDEGEVRLGVVDSDTALVDKWVDFRDTAWTVYSLTDTVSANDHDTIYVSLRTWAGGPLAAEALFDFCTLEQLK